MYIPEHFFKAGEVQRKYEIPCYFPKEYAKKVLKMKRRDIKKIEVCYNLPNIVDSQPLDMADYVQCDKMCIVMDKYNAFLFPLQRVK